MKKVLIAINFDEGLYNFRKELLEALIDASYEVHLAIPKGEFTQRLIRMGCKMHPVELSRRGTNPLQDIRLMKQYEKIVCEVCPDVVLTYTIKPNVYMGMVCKKRHVPYIATITGLGTAVEGNGMLQSFTRMLYSLAMKKVAVLFFQNEANERFFAGKRIGVGKHRMLPGSGVNLEHFTVQEFPEGEPVLFQFISRVMKEKGIEQFLDTAEVIKKEFPDTRFRILGFLEDDYDGKERFDRLCKMNIIEFAGSVEDVRPFIQESQCTLHPSFYPEGMSNVCLESAACGRAVITTDRPGCRDTVKDGITGFIIKERSSKDLIDKVRKFLQMKPCERIQMGKAARAFMEERFDRKIVVENYLHAIAEITKISKEL